MTTTAQLLRLPLVTLPEPVLPGAVVTIRLDDHDLARALAAPPTDSPGDASGPESGDRTGPGPRDRRLLIRVDAPADGLVAADADSDAGAGASGEGEIVVVGRVPDIGTLPTGERAAVIQIDGRACLIAVTESERAGPIGDAELITAPRLTPRLEAVARDLRATLTVVAELRRSQRLPELLRTVTDAGELADHVAGWAPFDDAGRWAILQAVDVGVRLELVLDWARRHVAELQVAASIRQDVSEGVDKQQREYLLRQQLDAIRRELGEGDDSVVGEYRRRLTELSAAESIPTEAAAAIDKEIARLERTSSQSPEHGWIRTWLDRVFELPWGRRQPETLDLDRARQILDDDHFGLDEVKDRIVEFLAVRKLRAERAPAPEPTADPTDTEPTADHGIADDVAERDDAAPSDGDDAHRPLARPTASRRGHGAIITLVGPPGVGKTSLGESVARAMNRSFVRLALGGIRDEAEIRGHRRTYVGAQPGRIVRALIEAGTSNPVILLDEVDKLSAGGWSGDPTAALLEVLDPAQNHTFRDHYLELDLDLSDVVFIATANMLDTIPGPLLDRMDVIRLDGYTEDEKVFIARRYLWPRQLTAAGLRADEVTLDDDALRGVIARYTREAGVRSLERELGKLARKSAGRVAAGADAPTIDDSTLADLLGRAKVHDDVPQRTELPGVATGLAVTGVGGDVLFIETTAFPTAAEAEPGLTLTGQLGEVMRESAQIALNYVRSHAAVLGIEPAALQRRFHVHVPAGAVPKDGPSAGITMTTALVSLLRDQPVRETVGMTGEITLQGAVLPIGGVKQKVLAAHRAGLREVVLPKRNEPDIDDVPERVRDEMTFHLAETYLDVVGPAFG